MEPGEDVCRTTVGRLVAEAAADGFACSMARSGIGRQRISARESHVASARMCSSSRYNRRSNLGGHSTSAFSAAGGGEAVRAMPAPAPPLLLAEEDLLSLLLSGAAGRKHAQHGTSSLSAHRNKNEDIMTQRNATSAQQEIGEDTQRTRRETQHERARWTHKRKAGRHWPRDTAASAARAAAAAACRTPGPVRAGNGSGTRIGRPAKLSQTRIEAADEAVAQTDTGMHPQQNEQSADEASSTDEARVTLSGDQSSVCTS